MGRIDFSRSLYRIIALLATLGASAPLPAQSDPVDELVQGFMRQANVPGIAIAVVQGGLTTSMELTANRRPFLYFPLRHHFEQNHHVRHRLERYGAGRRMDFEQETPETIAAAIAETIGQAVDYRAVETDGAARAAALIAPLLEERKGRRIAARA